MIDPLHAMALCALVIAAGMAGWKIRDIRARKAIARLGELHRANVAKAFRDGERKAIEDCMKIETENANRRP